MVCNKCDLPGDAAWQDRSAVYVSAATGEGLDALIAAIAARLVPQAPPAGQAVPFMPWHVATLAELRQALAGRHRTGACELLARFALAS